MIEFSPQVKKALKENRIGQFVHIDLLFFPMRLHGGTDTVKWEGHKWEGIGDSLEFSSPISPGLSLVSSVRGTANKHVADVTVPLDRKLGEALIYGYYVGRSLTVNSCALSESGEVLERIAIAEGEITKCSTTDSNTITFHAEFTKLDGSSDPLRDTKQYKDAAYKAGVRDRFRQNVLGVVQSQFRGDAGSFLVALVPFASPIIDFIVNSSSSLWRFFRLIRQRWFARRRAYKIVAENLSAPEPVTVSYLGGALKVRLGGRFKADNEKDAVILFHKYVKKRIWRIPRGFINLPFRVNGKMSGNMINLDHYRKEDDPQWSADTDPVRSWGKGEAGDQARKTAEAAESNRTCVDERSA